MTKVATTKWQGGKWIRPERRLAIHLRDDFTCAYCGRHLKNDRPGDVTLDHLVPRCYGGKNDSGNLVTACKRCNSSRQEKPWQDYATGGAIHRILGLVQMPVNLELAKALIAGTAGDAVETER